MRKISFLSLFLILCLSLPLLAAAAERSPAPQVDLYITTRCPWCTRAIAYLDENKVSYRLHDVEKDQEALARFLQLNPRGGVPFAVIGSKRILGFDRRAYADALQLTPP